MLPAMAEHSTPVKQRAEQPWKPSNSLNLPYPLSGIQSIRATIAIELNTSLNYVANSTENTKSSV